MDHTVRGHSGANGLVRERFDLRLHAIRLKVTAMTMLNLAEIVVIAIVVAVVIVYARKHT